MDAPNAPKLTNPNAQDQFVDAVQGPTIQTQGPASQTQVRGLAAQGPVNNNAQVGQMYLISLNNNLLQHNQSLLIWWCLSLRYFIKIG